MKLNAKALGLAAAGTFALVWVICSLLAFSLPEMTMMAGGNMMHMDLQERQWSMHPLGLLVGLVAWSVVAGLVAWLTATLYNKLTE